MTTPDTIKEKDFNFVLQNKLTKITQVLPKDALTYETNDEDITCTVKPFFGILQVVGLQQLAFDGKEMSRSSAFLKLYSITLALAIVCGEGFYIYVVLTSDTSRTPPQIVTLLLKLIPPTISAIISLLLSATCYQKMIIRVLNNINIVDKQLNIQNKNIYIPARNKMLIIFGSLFGLTLLMYSGLFFISEMKNYPEMIINYVVVGSLNELILLEICALLYLLTIRMNVLNSQLNSTKYDANKLFNAEVAVINKKNDHFLSDVTKKLEMYATTKTSSREDDEDQVDDITRLMRVFDRLADNTNIINSCFGIPLLCSAISAFMNILSTVNDLIDVNKKIDEGDEYKNLTLVIFCLRGIIFVVMVTVVIEKLQGRVNKTANIINKLSIVADIDPEREELLDRFSQLMSCRKFTITACNFFPFDFTFIYSLVGAVATYTVILLQVNPPETKSAASNSTNSSVPQVNLTGPGNGTEVAIIETLGPKIDNTTS